MRLTLLFIRGPGIPTDKLPPPEPDEIVVMLVQKIQVTLKIEGRQRLGRTHILQIVPRVRSGQVNGRARTVREIARVLLPTPRAAPLHPAPGLGPHSPLQQCK